MKKQHFLFGLMFLATLLSLAFVSAATGVVSITSPANGGTLTQNYNINVTNSTFDTMKNCTFTLGSTLTANTSVSLGTITNTSLIMVNTIKNSTIVEDANNYILTASCRNLTNDIATATAIGLIIQNTAPTAPSALTPASNTELITASTQTFSSTVVDAKTTSCTCSLTVLGNARTCTAANTAGTCSFTYPFTTDVNGQYTWTITASDGTDTAVSTSTILNVNIPGGGVGYIPAPGETPLQPGVTPQFGWYEKIQTFLNSIVNFFKNLF